MHFVIQSLVSFLASKAHHVLWVVWERKQIHNVYWGGKGGCVEEIWTRGECKGGNERREKKQFENEEETKLIIKIMKKL